MAITYRLSNETRLSVEQMDNNFHYVEDQISGITASIVTLNTNLASTTASIVTLNTNLASTTASIATLNTNLASTTASIATLNTNLASTTASIATLNTNLASATASIETIKPKYRVYTALITQFGEETNPTGYASGSLLKGRTYLFDGIDGDLEWDFTNVGGPKYPGTSAFVATDNIEPIAWGSSAWVVDSSAPIVLSQLENTIGNIYWEFSGLGDFYIRTTDNLFTPNKTYTTLQLWSDDNTPKLGYVIWRSENELQFYLSNTDGTLATYLGQNSNPASFLTSIEIRVYN
jgi:prefoldin subunit 5